MRLTLTAATGFGLEAVCRREIEALGYEVVKTEDGRVTFLGDERAIVRANLWLRTADRVQLKAAEFPAETSEDLFQMVKGLPWENLIPPDGRFPVTVRTVKSLLRSEPNNQKTVKKAIVERLQETYPVERFAETGALYAVRLSLHKNTALLTVDTTGESLHKRGYRTSRVAAPMKETLAAALVQLSFWKPGRMLLDPCVGSGTIPIEAALIGRNIAPGLSRHFSAEEWDLIPEEVWKEERQRAYQAINMDAPLLIRASDIDRRAVSAARANAEEAGVGEDILISRCDLSQALDPASLPDNGILLLNPPYGERIGSDRQISHIYKEIRQFLDARPDWSLFLVTSDRNFERDGMGRSADRRRKLYNGRIQVTYYQYHGVRKNAGKGSSGPGDGRMPHI